MAQKQLARMPEQEHEWAIEQEDVLTKAKLAQTFGFEAESTDEMPDGAMKNTQLYLVLENLAEFDPFDMISNNLGLNDSSAREACTGVAIRQRKDDEIIRWKPVETREAEIGNAQRNCCEVGGAIEEVRKQAVV